MKIIYICLLTICFDANINAQENHNQLKDHLRINLINPAIQYEKPINKQGLLLFNIGCGLGGDYTGSNEENGYFEEIIPFINVAYRNIYTLNKREATNNSGNFWGVRFLTTGPALAYTHKREADFIFTIHPIWGIQRGKNLLHYSFSIGPEFSINSENQTGFYPFMVHLTIGLNTKFNQK
ncbi:MAG: hypothetical protein N4A74_10040 [Carboxylicivirga sp.]|nr:hypothetical protein [Carboxylicivirga sp.]